MGRIATDVVLLPDETMTERAIRINRKLVEEQGSTISLGREACLPHITLGYGRAETDEPFPIPFTALSLALCHMGNHGTCRKVLVARSME